ncbi:protein translocase subunit SecF [Desulfovibrio psychrotolerans]|uniref:Protein-export membrane protein SecF n=1 Tax=Desulfovibrio psychrotolerans TaxID=415242 RepID=A0A7J0BQR8_9BACT|nr:protein translocase subunit SecF [Desulfovibrio psychrotolerans]GFM35414.1 protein-export membrane protein SecF [Desulfovibrio psychrotolerans]
MGLSIIKPDSNINFVGQRKTFMALSLVVMLVCLVSLVMKGGPRYGVDFAGGVMVQVSFDRTVAPEAISASLADAELPGLVVQRIGLAADNEFIIRASLSDANPETMRSSIQRSLATNLADTSFEIQRLEMVGPKVGSDLRSAALEALYYAVLLIAIYISGRFEQRWFIAGIMAAALATALYGLGKLGLSKPYLVVAAMGLTLVLCWRLKLNFALSAVGALIHDVFITVGVFSLLDKEFDLTIVAALLTIVGYSLNDTIIVFDRIRENIRGRTSPTYAQVVNTAVNQTLSRTLLTSGTTLLVILALFVLGGSVIHDFALAMLVGIGVGTYSSIFVASPILLALSPEELPEEVEKKEPSKPKYAEV